MAQFPENVTKNQPNKKNLHYNNDNNKSVIVPGGVQLRQKLRIQVISKLNEHEVRQ